MGPRQSLDAYRDRYAALFAEAPDDARCGEKTSYYLECTDACQLIKAVAPEARLLFIVREPVARAYSNYLWSRKNGLETLPFDEAVRLEGTRPNPLPPEKAYARPFDYLARGRYGELAEPFYQAFPAEQVRFFLYEDIVRRPEALASEIQEFLGVPEVSYELLRVGVVNSARETGPPLDRKLENELRERMRSHVVHFANVSGLDIGPWGY